MSTWSRSARLSIALALVVVAPAKAQFIDWDFDSDDGFWTTETAVGSESWSWSPGAWSVGNSAVPGLVRLISPEVTAGFVLGGVLVNHRYNFEGGCFDGGAASYRVNGGAWTPLDFFFNGYDERDRQRLRQPARRSRRVVRHQRIQVVRGRRIRQSG